MTTPKNRLAPPPPAAPPATKRRAAFQMTDESQVLWATNLQRRYSISKTTRQRYEASGALPPRDLFIGRRSGWRLATILAFEAAGRANRAA